MHDPGNPKPPAPEDPEKKAPEASAAKEHAPLAGVASPAPPPGAALLPPTATGAASAAKLPQNPEEALKAFEEAQKAAAQAVKKSKPPSRGGPLGMIRGFFTNFFKIRDEPTVVGKILMALLMLGLIFSVWFIVTAGGASENRIVPRTTLGTPMEVFGSFPTLWQDNEGNLTLLRHIMASFSRVFEGFLLAVLFGVPLGILCGTFKRIDAFLAPVSIFGRNVPISALVPLTMIWFGLGESQKVGFIFIACVAFVLFDASRAASDVQKDYLDTAYTLGASRWQVLTKVLIPLSMPDIFNSIRLLFGLAWGYIILAEALAADDGLGKLIWVSQRRGNSDHVYLVLLVITLLAFSFDRLLFLIQRQLFAYRYGR